MDSVESIVNIQGFVSVDIGRNLSDLPFGMGSHCLDSENWSLSDLTP